MEGFESLTMNAGRQKFGAYLKGIDDARRRPVAASILRHDRGGENRSVSSVPDGGCDPLTAALELLVFSRISGVLPRGDRAR